MTDSRATPTPTRTPTRTPSPTQSVTIRSDRERAYLHEILVRVGRRRHMSLTEDSLLNLYILRDRKWTITLPIRNDYPIMKVMRTGITKAKASVTSNASSRVAITCYDADVLPIARLILTEAERTEYVAE